MRLLLNMFLRELSRQPRKKYFYWKRVGFLAFISIVFWSLVQGKSHIRPDFGLEIFGVFISWSCAILVIITPAGSSSSILEEKANKTLPLLIITDMTPTTIVVGKFISNTFYYVLQYIACLPLMMFCISLGGISGKQILAISASILSFILLASAIGTFIGSVSNSKRVQGISLLILIVYFVATLIIQAGFYNAPQFTFSTAYALVEAIAKNDISYCIYNTIIQCLLTMFVLWLAQQGLYEAYLRSLRTASSNPIHYPTSSVASSTSQENKKTEHKQNVKKKATQVTRVWKKPIHSNPVEWRDYIKSYGGVQRSWMKFFICMIATGVLILMFEVERANLALGVALFVCSVSCAWTTFNLFVNSFAKEKENKTFELLLSTKLSDREIVWGKINGVFRSAFPLLIYTIVLILIMAETTGIEIFIYAVYWTGGILAAFSLAMYLSLRCKSTRKASSYSIFILAIWVFIMVGTYSIGEEIFGRGIVGFVSVIFLVIHVIIIFLLYTATITGIRKHFAVN